MPRTTADAGSAGEAFVAGRLQRAGYRIVDRNWRARGGELDIVALDGDILVFVEVKVRAGAVVTAAEETVDARKLRRLLLAAELYVEAHPDLAEHIWRIDLVAITLGADGVVRRYTHFENLTLE
ncbi:MAG: YraN family protein [Vicinamibacterales bacterium]